MAMFIRQENSRTELQERIAAELRAKMAANSNNGNPPIEYEKPASNIEDETHESQNLGPIVILIVAVVVLGIAYLLLSR